MWWFLKKIFFFAQVWHMTSITEKVLSGIVQRIIDEVSPERIILFGSRAKGTNTEQSDIDLLIIESEPFTPERSRRKEASRIWKALSEFDIPKDILVYSHEEVERWKSSLNHVIASALREGITLYVRP
jgi:predicted nucleotidyltransferase